MTGKLRDWETVSLSRYRDWETVSQSRSFPATMFPSHDVSQYEVFLSHEVFPSHDIPVNACTLRITAAAGTKLAGAYSVGNVKTARY